MFKLNHIHFQIQLLNIYKIWRILVSQCYIVHLLTVS